MFEGGFVQQPPSRVRGRPSHIQLEGFDPGESDDGVLNRYSRTIPPQMAVSTLFTDHPTYMGNILMKNMWPREEGPL